MWHHQPNRKKVTAGGKSERGLTLAAIEKRSFEGLAHSAVVKPAYAKAFHIIRQASATVWPANDHLVV